MTPHLIHRVSILGTGLIGGSFALALRKYATDLHITGWDRPAVARSVQSKLSPATWPRHSKPPT
jgi:prephenate dehydrogenase